MKKVILILALIAGFSMFFACKSAPAAVDAEPVAEEVVDVLDADDLDDAEAED